jgi:hypothetical protein
MGFHLNYKEFIMIRALFVVFVLAASIFVHAAEEPQPLISKKGKLLMQSDFSGSAVPKSWSINTGKATVSENSLLVSQKSSDMHIGAMRYRLELKDAIIALTFRFEGATVLNLGFDPAPGELKKTGHLYSVAISPNKWQIVEHNDKADPKSKTIPRAAADAKFEQGKTYTLLLEAKGDQAIAQIAGFAPLKAQSKDFAVKKPGLVFRFGGKDDQNVRILDVLVWAAE